MAFLFFFPLHLLMFDLIGIEVKLCKVASGLSDFLTTTPIVFYQLFYTHINVYTYKNA